MAPFYTMLRIRIKQDGSYIANAVKYDSLNIATRQFFSLIATDMGDETLVYHACHVMDNAGGIIETRVFDHRVQTEEE